MPTTAQLSANRANAQHSTGPTTPDGKSRSSRNAATHGAFSRALLLPTDDPHEFQHFHDAIISDLAPTSAVENFLARRAASLMWRLQRLQDAAHHLEFQTSPADLAAAYNDPDLDPPADRLARAEQRLQGMLNTTLRRLHDLQSDRREDRPTGKLQNEPNPTPAPTGLPPK